MKYIGHAALVDLSCAWLLRGVPTTTICSVDGKPSMMKYRYAYVFSEFVASALERPDVIGWYYGMSMVVECKRTRADFLADRGKPHMFDATSGMGRRRYYVVPEGLVTVDEVPAWCGLAYAKGRTIVTVKEAPLREISQGAAIEECSILTSAIRRHRLKVPWHEKKCRFETVETRLPTRQNKPRTRLPALAIAPELPKL